RQPAVEPLVEKVTVFGHEMPINMEAVMLAIAEKMELPGYGKDGFAPGIPFEKPEDFYLKMVANIAAGDKPGDAVPSANDVERNTFFKARSHLSPAVFDPQRWERAVVDPQGRNWWPHVIYVLNRGGRYEDFRKYLSSGDKLPYPFQGQFNLYVEELAETKHPYTGQRFSGIALVEPPRTYDGKVITDTDFPLHLITFKEILGGHSRTLPTDYWLSIILPENYILLNPRTAKEMGIHNGQKVRVVSATNTEGVWDLKNGRKIPVQGKVKLIQGLRPGVVAISWHFGHWSYGASDILLDGERVAGDKTRQKGLCANAVCRLDTPLKNVTLQDLIGGSASFYDTRVRLIPA
ncbi:MAG: molybdopterin oxidoreductase, partial [Calditrichaeota bacterium]